MDMKISKEDIKKSLTENVVTIKFNKVSGEERVMSCTLNPVYLPALVESSDQTNTTRADSPGVLRVWDVEKSGWRSMLWDNIKEVTV
jgi:hypothetical protein